VCSLWRIYILVPNLSHTHRHSRAHTHTHTRTLMLLMCICTHTHTRERGRKLYIEQRLFFVSKKLQHGRDDTSGEHFEKSKRPYNNSYYYRFYVIVMDNIYRMHSSAAAAPARLLLLPSLRSYFISLSMCARRVLHIAPYNVYK